MGRRTIHSMTGYGRAMTRSPIGSISVELRSTNHRYLEVESRLPSGLTALQGRLTELIRHTIRRGRVEVAVSIQSEQLDRRRVTFDEQLLQRYHGALMELKGRFGLKGAVTLDQLLALPQAVTIAEERLSSDRLWEPLRRTASAAVRELVRARRREGAKLAVDLRKQLVAIGRHVQAVKHRLPKALEQQRRELRRRLQELLGPGVNVSASQLEQAAALVRDVDVHEELVRLDSHLIFMRQTLASHDLVGKRLDFIAQELMREVNTLGAKVNDPEATHHVVDIKGCIEKIREQVQNLE